MLQLSAHDFLVLSLQLLIVIATHIHTFNSISEVFDDILVVLLKFKPTNRMLQKTTQL